MEGKGINKLEAVLDFMKRHKFFVVVFIIIVVGIFNGVKSKVNQANRDKEYESIVAEEHNQKLDWPEDSKMAKLLPTPEVKNGRVESNSEKELQVKLYKVEKDYLKKYMYECKKKNFTQNYESDETSYSAKDKNGNKLSLNYYKDDNSMTIYVEKEKKKNKTTVSSENEETTIQESKTKKTITTKGVTPKFKAMMDSYEDFFDKYIEFMKKYENSDDTSSMLNDYLDYMEKYTDTMEKMNELNQEDLSVADWNYYLKVHSRILKKLSKYSK